MPSTKSLADQLADLDDPTPKDFDPEDLDQAGQASDEDLDAVAYSGAGREHYEAVGKGKLRRQEPINLGKQYAGSRVSRDALEAESDDEPFRSGSSDDDEDGLVQTSQAEDSEEDGGGPEGPDGVGILGPGALPPLDYASNESNSEGVVQGVAAAQREKHGKKRLDGDEDKPKNRDGLAPAERKLDDREHMQPGERATKLVGKPDYDLAKHLGDDAEVDNFGVAEMDGVLYGHGDGKSSRHATMLREEGDDRERGDDSEGRVPEDSHSDGGDEEESEHDSSATDGNGEHDGRNGSRNVTDEREELRRLLSSDQRTIAAEISKAARGDVEKGRAVREQQSTFDALLNTRIKIQKGLGAANQLSFTGQAPDNAHADAIKSAESAALTLWSTLENLRCAMANAQSGREPRKRKHPSPASPAASTTSLWNRMADLESDSVAHRRAILDKWSLKVRGSSATIPNSRGKLLGSTTGGQQNISTILDAQIASEIDERNAKRARRETGGRSSTEPVYEDTVFYQSLLRSLVEQRISPDSVANGLDNLHAQLPTRLPVHPVTGMRNDKAKRDVDTRASKGRKMRYHVHEKLQNFMAPEDRGSWTDRAREEFFASLLGKTASGLLGEGDDDASAESEEDVEEGGLRLFRS